MNFSCALLNLSKIIIYLGLVSFESFQRKPNCRLNNLSSRRKLLERNMEINLVLTKYLRRVEKRLEKVSEILSVQNVQEAVDSISRFAVGKKLAKARVALVHNVFKRNS